MILSKNIVDIQELAELYLDSDNKYEQDKYFTLLYRRLLPGLRDHINRNLFTKKNYEEKSIIIEEIIGNTWLYFLENKNKYDKNRGKFSTWIYNTCRFFVLSYVYNRNNSHTLNNNDKYEKNNENISVEDLDFYAINRKNNNLYETDYFNDLNSIEQREYDRINKISNFFKKMQNKIKVNFNEIDFKIFKLRFLENRKLKEISNEIGLTIPGIKYRVDLLIKFLNKNFKNEYVIEFYNKK